MDLLNNDISNHQFLRASHAFQECSDEVQESIKAMLRILTDKDADEDERAMAAHTLADALFPNPHEGQLGMGLEQSESMAAIYSDEARQTLQELDFEEEAFAERLQALMTLKGITQCQLASLTGVSQPAISNMLNRQCRPQRRTVIRLAAALGVEASELWPQS